MIFTILSSGSAGNAALIQTETTRLLIDCGLSVKELAKRMAPDAPIGSKDGDAIVISHAHGDHAGCLPVVVRSAMKRGNAIPVYITPLTASRIDWGGIEHPPVRNFEAGHPFWIGDIRVDPFTVPHDCVDPVNFVFAAEGVKIGFSTDLGCVPPSMGHRFSDCQIIVLESNHDVGMLESGPHPPEVKERVAGRFGHLSNDQAAEFLQGISPDVKTVILGHLSEENNTPAVAEWAARRALLLAGSAAEILVASKTSVIRIFREEIRQ